MGRWVCFGLVLVVFLVSLSGCGKDQLPAQKGVNPFDKTKEQQGKPKPKNPMIPD